MSKHKKKKQREYSPPPLSNIDIFTYSVITIVVVFLALSAFFGIFYVAEVICYADEIVMLSYNIWTVLLLAPAWLITFLPLLNFFLTGFSEKKPIFGNKNVNYFSTTRYSKVDFLFKEKRNSKDKKTKVIVALVLVVVAVTCTLFGLLGRNSIDNNGEIKVYSVLNTVKKEYSTEDFSKVTIELGVEHTRYGNYRPMCWVRVENQDENDFNFTLSDAYWIQNNIAEKLSNIKTLKTVFGSKNIETTVIGKEYVDELIEYYELTDIERKLLIDLFSEV